MVYHGKPSPACGRCRARRLRCDQATPSCSQCIRAGEQCSGYRDPLSLVFRNQNEEVIRKAKQGQTAASNSRKRSQTKSHAKELAVQRIYSPSFPITDQATSFFHRNFVLESEGFLTFLTNYSAEPSSAVSSAVTALGLATLGNVKTAPSLMMAARGEYVKALSRTNHAIGDPILSKSDSTLAAVILLGMFERVTCDGMNSIHRWGRHIEGASKLIEWQGESLLQTQRGLEMFRHMRTQILISNVYKETRTPPIIEKLSQQAYRFSAGDGKHADGLSILRARLCDLCASIKQKHVTDPTSIIAAALALDTELVSWAINIPPSWAPIRVRAPPKTERSHVTDVYGDYYFVYTDLLISDIWNDYRATRYAVHEIILYQLSILQGYNEKQLTPEYSKLASKSKAIMKQIAENICASVPYHIGLAGKGSPIQGVCTTDCGRPAAAGYILTWHLFLAANCKFAPPSLKSWATTYMEKIGRSMGINQALSMACVLGRGRPTVVIGVDTEVDEYIVA